MTKIEQIKDLFSTLSLEDKKILLSELSFNNNTGTVETAKASAQCPYCKSELVIRHGTRNNIQKYKCKSCHRVFTSVTGTSHYHLQKREKFDEYQKLMGQGYMPLKTIAAKIGISMQTAFDWRHKILCNMKDTNRKFEGLTEMDDVWFLYSQKGRKGLKYSRKRGGSKRKGDNNFQVKMLITADRNSNTDLSVVRIGRLKKSDIERKVGGKISQGSTLISDKHRSISSFAKSEKLGHVSFTAKKHTAGGEFHIQNVNNIASRLKSTINHGLRGVSTKYLQSYANWFSYIEDGKDNNGNLADIVNTNNQTWETYTNLEDIYRMFIENLSVRTYRCPIKRKWKSQINYTSTSYEGNFI